MVVEYLQIEEYNNNFIYSFKDDEFGFVADNLKARTEAYLSSISSPLAKWKWSIRSKRWKDDTTPLFHIKRKPALKG